MEFLSCAGEVTSCSRPSVPFQPQPRLTKGSKPHSRPAYHRALSKGARPVPPCRVTNTGEEMRDPELWGFDPNIIEIDQKQIPQPHLGPLERRVELTYEEALFAEDISIEDTQYWFTEPAEGWNQEKKKLRKATEIPNEYANAENFGDDRIKAYDLKEGQEMVGTIGRTMLFHGAQVDIEAEYDALIPINEDSWVLEVQQAMMVGVEVRIKIFKIVTSPLCRFPIIAELLSPNLEGLLPKVKDYEPVFDLRGQSDMELAKELTGRKYTPIKYWLDTTPDSKSRAFDAVNPEVNGEDVKEISETLSPALMSRIREMAAVN